MDEHEVRVVDPSTGGEKGQKLARFDLIPAGPLWEVARHYGVGARKYEDRNWERGYRWSLSFGAMMRHAWLFWRGEDRDPETGTHHMAAVVFHALALIEFTTTHPQLDDRVQPEPTVTEQAAARMAGDIPADWASPHGSPAPAHVHDWGRWIRVARTENDLEVHVRQCLAGDCQDVDERVVC